MPGSSDAQSSTAHQGYALANAWELANRRLDLLEACHDRASFRRATTLGVGPGWRCLEVGAGSGSFARWLGTQVGDGGSVIAADIDVHLMAGMSAPNVEVRQMDVVTDDLPQGAFDFVHTRLVLMHIPARDDVLSRLVGALRPGGVLMLEEHDVYPVFATSTGAHLGAWEAFVPAMKAVGVNPEWGRELPQRLGSAGLVDVDAEIDVPMFRGGSAHAQFWSLTWQQARARVIAMGVDEQVISLGQADLEAPDRWFQGPAMVAAWGRRPTV